MAFYALAADPFHVERLLSLRPPIDKTWPPRFRDAIAKGAVMVGMSRAMVAASIGYPTIFADIAGLQKMDVWRYDAPAPFSSSVYFQNGVVVRYDPPGNLP